MHLTDTHTMMMQLKVMEPCLNDPEFAAGLLLAFACTLTVLS